MFYYSSQSMSLKYFNIFFQSKEQLLLYIIIKFVTKQFRIYNIKMEKQDKENFVELPYLSLKKKYYTIPSFLLQTKLQRNKRNLTQIKTLIKEQGFQYICYVSDERQIFAAKRKQTNKVSLLQIKQYNQKSKCVYLSLNITSCLKPNIRPYFSMKNWKFEDKYLLQDQRTGKGLVLIQYNFVQYDLRTYMQKLQLIRQKIKLKQYKNILKNLIQNLCQYHLANIIVGDITPQLILHQNNSWFILLGDNSQKITQDFSTRIHQPLNPSNKILKYLSPLEYNTQKSSNTLKNNENINNTNIRQVHNTFKSDVYSLGLCLLELQLINLVPKCQIDHILIQDRNKLYILLAQCQQTIRQNYIIKVQADCKNIYRQYKVPNHLIQMLAQKQPERPYIFQICLMTNFYEPLLKKYKIHYQQYFKFDVINIPNSTNRKKIYYPHTGIQYQGQIIQNKYSTNSQNIKRQGRGILLLNGMKIFEGQWKNNMPIKKCQIRFNQLLSYQGQIFNDKFHGNGYLRFNETLLGTSKWYKNLREQKVAMSMCKQGKSTASLMSSSSGMRLGDNSVQRTKLQNGIYLVICSSSCSTQEKSNRISIEEQSEQLSFEYKIYFMPKHNKKVSLVFNLYYLKNNCHFMAKWLSYNLLQKSSQIQIIKIKGIIPNSTHCLKPCEQIQVQIKQIGNVSKNILFITQIGSSFSFIVQFIKQFHRNNSQVLKVKKLEAIQIKQLKDENLRDIINQLHQIEQINLMGCQNLTDNAFRNIIKKCNNTQDINKIRNLNLSFTKITQKAINQLLYSNAILNIRKLKLNGCTKITSQKLAQLLSSQKISHLQTLQLSQTNINNHVLQKILQSSYLKSLTSFDISLCHKFTQNLLSSFFSNQLMKNLQYLSLHSCSIKDAALQSIKDLSHFQLIDLDISGCINLTLQGIWKLISTQKMKKLKKLNLSFLSIDDSFLICLAQNCYAGFQLQELSLEDCRLISQKGINSIIKSKLFLNLRKFNIKKTRINNTTLFGLISCNNKKLSYLDISKCCSITDEGLQKFAQSKILHQITHLDISYSPAGPLFINALSNFPHSQNIQYLNLSQCKNITQISLISLLSSKNIKSLLQIDLSGTLVSQNCLLSYSKNCHIHNNLINFKLQNCKNITEQHLKSYKEISHLVTIAKNYNESSQNIQDLCRSGYLLKMNQLTLTSNTNKQIKQIFKSHHLVNLQTIKFNFMNVDTYIDTLIQTTINSNLKEISLLGCQFDEKKIINFFRSPFAQKIQKIDLSWTECSSQVLSSLTDNQKTSNNIKILRLAKCIKINDRGLTKFLSSSKSQMLTQLDLRSTLITNNTIEAVSNSKYLTNLKKLIVRACQNLRDVGFRDLFKSKNCKSLQYIDISWTNIGSGIFNYMSQNTTTCTLTQVLASGIKQSQKQICKFLTNQNSSYLTFIDLSYSDLSSQFFPSLQNSHTLKSLSRIDLRGIPSQILKKGWPIFAKNTHIRQIFISNCDQSLQNLISIILKQGKDIQKIIVSGCTGDEIDKVKRSLRTNKVEAHNMQNQQNQTE